VLKIFLGRYSNILTFHAKAKKQKPLPKKLWALPHSPA